MNSRISDNEIESILVRFDAETGVTPEGLVAGKNAPDFSLVDQNGSSVKLSELSKAGVLLLVYPNDFTFGAETDLNEFRDALETYRKIPLTIAVINSSPTDSNAKFAKQINSPFRFLSDTDNKVTRILYGSNSQWLLEKGSRGYFLVNGKNMVLYRSVEPSTLSSSKVDKIATMATEIKAKKGF